MAELLHAGALGASALGACCVALDAPRPRRREFVLMAVMVLGMLDIVAGVGALPVVTWSALIALAALALAVRRRRRPETASAAGMRVHSALAGVLMAALMLAMGAGSAASAHHGASAGMLAALLLVAAGVVSASALWRARRGHPLERLQYASTAASLLLLAGALL